MADNLHIVGRSSHLGSVQKTYNWQVRVPKPTGVNAPEWEEDLLLRARSAAIPGAQINAIESQFMGMKQFFAGNAELEHQLSVEFEEFEDQKVLEFLNGWISTIFDFQNAQGGGGGQVTKKEDYAVDVELIMYSSDREKLEKKVTFHNCWLQNLNSVSLSYGDSASVKYPANFQWDYYTVDRA